MQINYEWRSDRLNYCNVSCSNIAADPSCCMVSLDYIDGILWPRVGGEFIIYPTNELAERQV